MCFGLQDAFTLFGFKSNPAVVASVGITLTCKCQQTLPYLTKDKRDVTVQTTNRLTMLHCAAKLLQLSSSTVYIN